MINRLDRHVGSTVLISIVVILLLFLLLVCAFALLEEIGSDDAGYGFAEAARYVLLTAPRRAYELLPYVTFLGALIGIGALASANELVVFRAAGVSVWRLFRSVALPVLLVTAAGMLMGETLAPVAETEAEAAKERARQQSDDVQIKGGQWYREGDLYMSVAAIGSGGELVGIRQYQLAPNGALSWSRTAAKGRYLSDGRWRLEDVVSTRFDDDRSIAESYSELDWQSQADPALLSTQVLVDPSKLSLADLRTQVAYLEREGLQAERYQLALWSKLFLPLSMLGLALLAVTFVLGPLREVGMGARLTVGILVALGFKYLQDLFAPMAQVYGLHPALAVGVPVLLCWLLAAASVRRVG